VVVSLELSLGVSYTRSQCRRTQMCAWPIEEEGMASAVTSEAGKYKRNWKKLCFLACMCAVATGLLFLPLGSSQTTVQFLAGAVWGLAIGGVFNILFRGKA
jgi:hypothetical protein